MTLKAWGGPNHPAGAIQRSLGFPCPINSVTQVIIRAQSALKQRTSVCTTAGSCAGAICGYPLARRLPEILLIGDASRPIRSKTFLSANVNHLSQIVTISSCSRGWQVTMDRNKAHSLVDTH